MNSPTKSIFPPSPVSDFLVLTYEPSGNDDIQSFFFLVGSLIHYYYYYYYSIIIIYGQKLVNKTRSLMLF